MLFVCFSNNIFWWRRFARSVLKIFFVFLFPDSFQLLVDVYIHISLVSELLDMHVNSRICPSSVTLLFSSLWESFSMKFFIISFFVSIPVFRKWISFSRFAIILSSTSVWCSSLLYRFIFCLISFCIWSRTSFFISFSKMSLIFWYLIFLYALPKTSNIFENSVASGSVSLDIKESIWCGTPFKGLARFAFFFNYWSICCC